MCEYEAYRSQSNQIPQTAKVEKSITNLSIRDGREPRRPLCPGTSSMAVSYPSSVSSDYTMWGQEEVPGGNLHTGGESLSRMQPSLGVTQSKLTFQAF